MICFGDYLKDYLEYNKISQTEFANRLNISQKHMNELIAGKTNITAQMAYNLERLTGISSSFIIKVENERNLKRNLLDMYNDEKNLLNMLKKDYYLNELKKCEWIKFKNETNTFQLCIDLLDFLGVSNFEAHDKMQTNVFSKKKGENYNKLALFIARCDELVKEQKVNKYNKNNFDKLIKELIEYSYTKEYDLDIIKNILNKYGILFVCEKALSGTKIRGCMKVKVDTPAIYITKNYSGKDSLYFELLHELGHLKSDYNMAQSKVLIDGDEEREKRADLFALNTMIEPYIWDIILNDYSEDNILKISKDNKIPMSFIVGRLASNKLIKYDSNLYNKYKLY